MRLRRAILIYLATIVVPCLGLLWLGVRSFETQRRALAALKEDKLNQETEKAIRAAAGKAVASHHGSIARHFFIIEHGVVTSPALHAPPPQPEPAEFLEAERQETAHPET